MANAQVALAIELKPDLVILDIKMPSSDGIAAAEQIAAARIAPVVSSPRSASASSSNGRAKRCDAMLSAVLGKGSVADDRDGGLPLAEITSHGEEVGDLSERLEARRQSIVPRAC